MKTEHDIQEAPKLFVDTLRHFSSLLQHEVQLARAEMSRNVSRAVTGLVFFGIAALLTLVAFNVLASALVAWIASAGLSVGVSALIVGGGLLALAIGLVLAGRNRLSAKALAPNRTVENVKRDIDSLQEATHA